MTFKMIIPPIVVNDIDPYHTIVTLRLYGNIEE